MNILITNDDGIMSEGINALYNLFSKHHSTYIIAPDSERSACSNAITVHKQLTVKRLSENKFSLSGFPADCVIVGLSGNIIPEVDLIISGINHGPNVGDDLIFSGTVGAARTAYILGKPAIAISINCFNRTSQYLDDAAAFLLDFVGTIQSGILGIMNATNKNNSSNSLDKPFFNINYPDLTSCLIKGKKYTYVGRRIYKDSFNEMTLDSDEMNIKMGGYIESVMADGSDTTELEKGFISITPLKIDSTDYTYFNMNK